MNLKYFYFYRRCYQLITNNGIDPKKTYQSGRSLALITPTADSFFVTKMCSLVQVKFTINDEFNVILTSKPPINDTYWMECFIVVAVDIQYYLYQMTMEIPSHGHKGCTSPRLFFLPPSIGTIDSANPT